MRREAFLELIREHGVPDEDIKPFRGLFEAMLTLLPETAPATTLAQIKQKDDIDGNRILCLSLITAMVIVEAASCDVCGEGEVHAHELGVIFEDAGEVVKSILQVVSLHLMASSGIAKEADGVANPLAAAILVTMAEAKRQRRAAEAHRAVGLADDGRVPDHLRGAPDAPSEAPPTAPERPGGEDGGSPPGGPFATPDDAFRAGQDAVSARGDGPMGVLRGGEDRV